MKRATEGDRRPGHRGDLRQRQHPHARKVTAYLDRHPRLELLYGARYSPHDNPAERISAALKNHVANTAETGRRAASPVWAIVLNLRTAEHPLAQDL